MQDARWLALAAPSLIFAAHALHGSVLPQTALAFVILNGLLVCGAIASPAVRRSAGRTPDLTWPTVAFLVTLALVLWSLTPWPPGGAHPVWSFTGIAPAAGTLDKSQTLLELIKLLGLTAPFFLGVLVAGNDDRTRLTLNVVVLLGAVTAIWSVSAALAQGFDVNHQRLAGPFGNPNTMATLLGTLLTISVGLAMRAARSSGRRKAWEGAAPYVGALLLFAGCLLATASRGGALATAVGLAMFAALLAFAGRLQWSKALLGGACILAAGAGALALSGELFLQRVMETSFESAGRRLIFQPHWDAFLGAPLSGYGLGTFDTVNRLILDKGNIADMWVVRAAHNVYLTWLEQGGLLGAVPMFVTIATILNVTFWGAIRRKQMTTVLFGLLSADVVILVHGLSDFALETYSMAMFWSFLLGLQFAASESSRRR